MRGFFIALLIFTVSHRLKIFGIELDNDETELQWSTSMGNAQNTYRIVPSVPTNYSKLPWTYEFSLTSQDTTELGRSAGINGNFIVCLTTNGEVRWTTFIEPVPEMDPIGLSNIVSDRQGVLYYTISWSGDTIYTAKICRITQAQTSHPVQKCIENADLFMYINSPLAINEKYDLLVTAVSDNEIDSVPVVLDKKTLKILWKNIHVFGAGMEGHYRCDTNNGDILWFGGDDRLLKFDYKGQKLLNNYTQTDLSGSDFVLDKQQQIIVRPWQNGSELPWKLVVSSHDVSARQIKLRWTWYAPPLISDNDDITSPVIDDKGIVYLASMPLAFALDNQGKIVWTTQVATASEIETYNLFAVCTAMNSKRRVLYIVVGSPYFQKKKFLYFITAVNMDTGKVIKRIDLNLGTNQQIEPQCPILIGDEMFYFSWLTGQYPKSVPFKVMGIPQL